jgi:phenylalanyl-tRNA synthetase alpha chain
MTAPQEFQSEIDALAAAALDEVAAATTRAELEAAQTSVLGRGSALVLARRMLGDLDPDQRPDAGKALNGVKSRIEAQITERMDALISQERATQLESERMDLTEDLSAREIGHLHLVTQTWQRLEDVFVGMGFSISEGPELETDWYNFEALNFPEGHTARDLFDTLYVDVGEPESHLLRTHTSPVQIRVMENQDPPIYTVAPGRVFRRDTADATHMPMFHQIEGLVVDTGITFGDMVGTMDAFVQAYFGRPFTSRLRPSFFPFTEPSAEFDILTPDGSWLELAGCGMVHPNVLSNGGIDPEEYSGFAFGFGIDRLAMMRHHVVDLREMFANDIRFLRQF